MNDENLKGHGFHEIAASRQREIARKGQAASVKKRKEKADMRKAAMAVLEGTYTAKGGEQITGIEMLIRGLIKNLSEPGGRNWSKTVDFLMTLTDAAKSPTQKKREEADLELVRTKIKLLQGGDDEALNKLDAILGNLERVALNDSTDAEPETE